MTGKRSKRLNSALRPLGVLALVAGCGGGAAMSTPGGGTTYVPPTGKQMTTATLNLLVPGRRPSSGSRGPRYVSPGTSCVDVSAVAAGAPSPLAHRHIDFNASILADIVVVTSVIA